MTDTFTIRTLYPGEQRVDVQQFDLIPKTEQAEAVCDLFLRFLADRPPGFREELPFLKQGGTELEWAAAEGGSALATFYEGGEPLSMGILLSGLREESDERMLSELRTAIGEPLFGEHADVCMQAPERPVLLNVLFPEHPELIPRTQLLAAALSSVFFRVVYAMRAEEESGAADQPS